MTDHGELGALLRSWRDRLSPADVGTTAFGVRRAAGLRREELAALAGVSVDYVVRLEQGRARTPSAQVVAALGRALQLDRGEQDHLYRLAGLQPPGEALVSTHVPPGVQRLVTRMGDNPIAVFTAAWDLLTWSSTWAGLFGEPAGRTPWERNLVVQTFHEEVLGDRAGRARHADGGAEFRASLVADLRRTQGRHPHDPRLRGLIDRLRETSPEFAGLWDTGAVGEHLSQRKTIDHPVVGDLEVDCDVFTVSGSELRIVTMTVATGSPAAEKLDFLRVAGAAALS
ncbi:Helix-turn-helix domain-containing protein [Klenkia soli]|uniref:Helix-turn-helix domain-containing protein n=1 Tax=Klenkia soli TaxID=1052260 RepID=A0A1H0PA93_9ACTN|nr:helix-turn-helix transcriptional regulator [Klenkia soli]SDP01579.1 Helix-turn-helix domain-containing protein [Klenkia soli]